MQDTLTKLYRCAADDQNEAAAVRSNYGGLSDAYEDGVATGRPRKRSRCSSTCLAVSMG